MELLFSVETEGAYQYNFIDPDLNDTILFVDLLSYFINFVDKSP